MIYAVECSYNDRASEVEWNAFYSFEKLPALISVAGINTSQRFKALTPGCPKYLALHSVACPDVLLSAEYRLKGGGNFAKWQSHITDWHRNVYEGIELMPAVGPTDLLALSFDGSSAFEHDDEAFRLEAVALDMKPAFRWLRVFDLVKVDLARLRLEGLALYEPMGKRLMPGVRNE